MYRAGLVIWLLGSIALFGAWACGRSTSPFSATANFPSSGHSRTYLYTDDELAYELDLDEASFATCMNTHRHLEAIRSDFQAITQAGGRSRPAFDIGAQRLVRTLPLTQFEEALHAAIP